jgi:membrane protein DedA with SNARE-associated domain
MFISGHLVKCAGIIFTSLVSEDAAMLGAAFLSSSGMLPTGLAFASTFLGIWVGDLLLYAVGAVSGRRFFKMKWVRRFVGPERIEESRRWFKHRGPWALVLCRIVPGTRLPTYLAAGVMRLPFFRFAWMTGVLALVWISLVFALVHIAGMAAKKWLDALSHQLLGAALACASIAILTVAVRRKISTMSTSGFFQRWSQWEFWPAWLFYLPVAACYARLALRHRCLTLPSSANPGMFTGGLVGESKFATLDELQKKHPDFTTPTRLLPGGPASARLPHFLHNLQSEGWDYPVILKPDSAQRGCGFKVIRSSQQADRYLQNVTDPLVLQPYVPGPFEAGIFYVRHPGQERGRIFAITEKIFPHITGDGLLTVEALIRADARASILAETYCSRFPGLRHEILPVGHGLRLVEAGNHAQGCIFQDGFHLWSEQLEARIDEISRSLEEFYFGRYDLRYANEAELRRGEGFRILELNGAASEATHIYDSRKNLREAYGILFEQWDLVFRIGAANRERGYPPCQLGVLWHEWRQSLRRCATLPHAD